MTRPVRITDEQLAYARRVTEVKRRLAARLRKLPTVEQLAEQIGCEPRYLEKILSGQARVVPVNGIYPLGPKRQHKPGKPTKHVKYADLNPLQKLKANARSHAKMALKRGQLTRASCRDCGDPNTQMHHEDYASPLVVVWLCRKCHMHLHQQRGDLHGKSLVTTVAPSKLEAAIRELAP